MSTAAHARADLVLLLVTLLAAAGWIFSKEALQGLPPLFFIGIRFLLAGVVLVPVMGWVIFRERAPLSTWVSLPVAVAGLGLLSLRGGFTLAPGQGWFLLAALCFSLHFTLMARIAPRIPAVILTAIQLLMVGMVNLVISALTEPWPQSVTLPVVGWLLASALVATSLRFALQTYGQSLAPASHVALLMTLEPVWTALLGALWYGQSMALTQLLGCSLIFGAMLISRWRWLRGLFSR